MKLLRNNQSVGFILWGTWASWNLSGWKHRPAVCSVLVLKVWRVPERSCGSPDNTLMTAPFFVWSIIRFMFLDLSLWSQTNPIMHYRICALHPAAGRVSDCIVSCSSKSWIHPSCLCVLQPLGRFCGDGGGSVQAPVPPGPLARFHSPELDPGCGPACCHGNKMMSGV